VVLTTFGTLAGWRGKPTLSSVSVVCQSYLVDQLRGYTAIFYPEFITLSVQHRTTRRTLRACYL